jgi:PAS domain S-box-containing protein
LDSGQNIVQEVTCGKRIVSVVAAPVVEGRYVNLYGRDVTKERKAEQALQKARDELEKKVEERTAELIQAVGLLREEAEQRMQAQEAVKAERQRFSNVLETLPAYVCLLTPDYYMPFANRVFREWFGYHPDKKCYEFLFNRTEPCETCETFTVLKTNQSHRWEWTGPNGRNYDIFDFPFKDTDGSQLILEMGMDITELKRAEKAVRGSEERYRSLTVATTQVVWTTDADGQVAGDLPSWRAFTGQDERQIQGWGWIESLHPNDRERTAEIWSQAVRDRALYQTEYRLRRHDGQYRHVSVRGVPVIEPDGRIREWIGACTDITEKKTAEEELDNYRMRLEDLVKQRTQELARSNRDLEQFAYVASHDLQEPLRAIAGFVELLKRNLQSSLDTKTTEYMNFTVDGAVRMQSLISGLLEYSRVGTHGQKPEQTDPRAALERAVANLRMSIKESGAEIATDDLPMVYFDGMQLSQLLQNLISNAIKFRAEQAPRIRISAARLDDSWRFAVADNGIGIDPQYAERIFLIFQRLHSREEYPGTGIGLSICKKIVERHNGKIWVESKPGDGSTFYFTVPDKGETN